LTEEAADPIMFADIGFNVSFVVLADNIPRNPPVSVIEAGEMNPKLVALFFLTMVRGLSAGIVDGFIGSVLLPCAGDGAEFSSVSLEPSAEPAVGPLVPAELDPARAWNLFPNIFFTADAAGQ
jgi:hypothetical protein